LIELDTTNPVYPPSKSIFDPEEEFEDFSKMSNIDKRVFLEKHKNKMIPFK